MSNRATALDKPLRRARLFGLGVCSLVVLAAACSQETRDFSDGTGGTGLAGSSSTTGSCDTPDPDCECVDGQVVARDVDKDGEGTQLCEAAPGPDCNDGDNTFVRNECGGCNKDLGGKVGDPCQSCGVFQCQGDFTLQCATPNPAPRQCAGNTVQVCAGGQWTADKVCAGSYDLCHNGICVECVPGTFKCGVVQGTDVVIKCLETGSWESSWTSCTAAQSCSASTGTCIGLFHPRDIDFEVPRLLRDAPDAPAAPAAPGLRTQDVLDLAVGFAFG